MQRGNVTVQLARPIMPYIHVKIFQMKFNSGNWNDSVEMAPKLIAWLLKRGRKKQIVLWIANLRKREIMAS